MGWLARRRQRRRLEDQQAQYLEQQGRLQARALEHQEHLLEYYNGIIDPTSGFEDWYYIAGGLGQEHGMKGARDDFGLSEMRRVGRDLDWNNAYGIAFGKNMQNHAIGKGGMTTDLATPEDPPDEFAGMSDEEWDEVKRLAKRELKAFAKRNKWGAIQRECGRNVHRDGDYLIREFVGFDGDTTLRPVDPANLKSDPAGKYPGGIITDEVDEQLVLGYWIDGQEVPANEVHHLKVNTDLDVHRGVPTLWPAREDCLRGAKILKNMAHVVEVQAAIAAVEECSSPLGVTDRGNFLDSMADKTSKVDFETGNNVRQRKIHPGSFVQLAHGNKLTFNTSSGMLPGIVEARADVIRTIAAQIVFPEFMLSADASNNNFASILVAGTPATKNFQAQQGMFEDYFAEIIRGVLWNKVILGLLKPATMALEIKLTGPEVEIRDPLKTAQTREIELRNKIISPQQWTAERQGNLDYDTMQRQIREHAELMQPGQALTVPPEEDPEEEPPEGAAQTQPQAGATNT